MARMGKELKMYNETRGLVNTPVRQLMRWLQKGSVPLLLFAASLALACDFDLEAQYLGDQGADALDANIQVGDKFVVACGDSIPIEGMVSESGLLRMTNGAEMTVKGLTRKAVLIRLERMQSMVHSPNGLQIVPE